jgi:hypothetical protein
VQDGTYEPDWCCSCDAQEVNLPEFADLEETAME